MSKAKRYTLETLLPLNVSYDSDHGLTQEDVDMVNSLVEVIESTRSKHTPKIGRKSLCVSVKRVICTTRCRLHSVMSASLLMMQSCSTDRIGNLLSRVAAFITFLMTFCF